MTLSCCTAEAVPAHSQEAQGLPQIIIIISCSLHCCILCPLLLRGSRSSRGAHLRAAAGIMALLQALAAAGACSSHGQGCSVTTGAQSACLTCSTQCA